MENGSLLLIIHKINSMDADKYSCFIDDYSNNPSEASIIVYKAVDREVEYVHSISQMHPQAFEELVGTLRKYYSKYKYIYKE